MFMEQALYHTRLGSALDVHPMARTLGDTMAATYLTDTLLPWHHVDQSSPALTGCIERPQLPDLQPGLGHANSPEALFMSIDSIEVMAESALLLMRQGVRLADPSLPMATAMLRILRETPGIGVQAWHQLCDTTAAVPVCVLLRMHDEATFLFSVHNQFRPYYQASNASPLV